MSPSLHEFPRWGPYGLYATFVMMLFTLPLGWLYAYVAFVGSRRDITEPDPQRQKAALGGAIMIAILILVFRHVLTSDTERHPDWDSYKHILTWTFNFSGAITRSILEWVGEQAHQGAVLWRIFWALIGAALAVVLFGLVLIAVIVVWALVAIALVVIMLTSGAAVVAATMAAIVAFPGFLLGVPILLYFLFVRLPLQVVYRQAIREGRWPTTEELVLALRKGTLDKADWQSKIMAYKSGKFETALNNQNARLRRSK